MRNYKIKKPEEKLISDLIISEHEKIKSSFIKKIIRNKILNFFEKKCKIFTENAKCY